MKMKSISLSTPKPRDCSPFFGQNVESRGELENRARDDLRAIIGKALELDNMFMTSKAIFRIVWRTSPLEPGEEQYYDSEVMDAEAYIKPLTSDSVIDFFISPILIKIGNADGENFDSRMILAKALVACD